MTLRSGAASLLLAAGCAAAGGAAPPRTQRVWPDPPQPARIRWVGSFPGEGVPAGPARPWWRTALRAIVGLPEREEHPAPLLARPFGLAALEDGFVVADPDLRKVLRVAWPERTAREVRCSEGEWLMPMAVARAPDGTLFVADGGAGRVVAVPPSGPCRTIGAGLLRRPAAVAWHAGVVYVVDPPRHAVDAFDAGGAHLGAMGQRGDASGAGVNFPTGIAVGPDGTLFVVDSLNFRVSRFGADGAYRGSFGAPGDGGGAFARPKGIAVDPDGRAFVSDSQHDVVIVFSPAAAFEYAIGGSGSGAGALSLPAGVALLGGRLYVASSYNRRVEVYELLGGTP